MWLSLFLWRTSSLRVLNSFYKLTLFLLTFLPLVGRLFNYSETYSFICLFAHPPFHPSNHPFLHPSVLPSIHSSYPSIPFIHQSHHPIHQSTHPFYLISSFLLFIHSFQTSTLDSLDSLNIFHKCIFELCTQRD